MQNERYRPSFDKLYLWISIPTSLLVLAITVITAIFEATTLLVTVPVTLLIAYFLISPLFGYAELREKSLFVKFGFFLKKEIPYQSIRGVEKCRKFYSDSMLSLKNSMEHINIKYNRFDILSVSLNCGDDFIEKLNSKIN